MADPQLGMSGSPLWLALFGATLITGSNSDGLLNSIGNFVIPAVLIGYLGLALIAMVRTWLGSSQTERRRHGLTMIAAGAGIPLAILLVILALGFMNVTIPGLQWIVSSIVLIPITCALAAVKSARAGGQAAT